MEIDALYACYVARQSADQERMRKDSGVAIPRDFEFDALPGLSNELKDRLAKLRPDTMAQAYRIEGMTPAALAILSLSLGNPPSLRA